MFLLQNAIRINREGVGYSFNAEHFCYGASETAIELLRPGHFILGDELLPFLLVGIQAYVENNQGLPLKLIGDIANMRKRFTARSASGCPEIE